MKKIIALILVVVLCAGLVSCHGADILEEFVMPDEFDENALYEITFWAKNDTNVNQTRIYEKAMADFEALYPNIKITLKLYTDYGRIYNDVITNISTRTTPNVCITYPDHIATYLTGRGSVVALNELFEDEKYGLGGSALKYDSPSFDEMVSKYMEECSFGGAYYAIPFMRSTEACYVNKTYVEALGYELPEKLTWEFIWEVSEAAMAKDSGGNFIVNGQKVMIPFIYKSTDNMMIQMLRQRGAGYSSEAGDIMLFNDTTRQCLQEIAVHAESGAFSTFKISSYPANFLNAGQCIFAVDSTAGATWMGSNAPLADISEEAFVDFETAVMTIPQFDINNPQMISQGPSVCIFNKEDPGEVLASWLFAQYLLTDGVQIAYSQTEGYVPVTEKARRNKEYIDYMASEGKDNELYYDVKIISSKLLIENTENTFTTPVFNGSASLRNAAGALIEDVVKTVRRSQPINDEYYENLYADMISLYRLDQISREGDNAEKNLELGKLPAPSLILLISLATVWVFIGTYFLLSFIKKKKMSNKAL